jgi:hypothetical protein
MLNPSQLLFTTDTKGGYWNEVWGCNVTGDWVHMLEVGLMVLE